MPQVHSTGRAWDSEELRNLRAQRNNAINSSDRKILSKQIYRITRRRLREYRTDQANERLREFKRLEVLEQSHMYPILKKHTAGPNYGKCGELLQQLYSADVPTEYSSSCDVPPFTLVEIQRAIKSMRKGRCTDKSGLITELFLFGGIVVHESLQSCINHLVRYGDILSNWCETFFVLLHKRGNTEAAINWRPIALLNITYKILARLMYSRIRNDFDKYQSDE